MTAFSSAASQRLAIAGTLGQPVLAPALAAVLRAEDLAGLRGAIDLARVARMQRDRHHRLLGLDPVIKALPGLADIAAAENPAVKAAERRGERREHHVRVVRRGAQVAAV